MTYTVAIIVGYHLQVTAASYLIDMRNSDLNTPPAWLEWVVDMYAWMIIAIILLFPGLRWLNGTGAGKRLIGGWNRKQVSVTVREDKLDQAAISAAYLSVIYVMP